MKSKLCTIAALLFLAMPIRPSAAVNPPDRLGNGAGFAAVVDTPSSRVTDGLVALYRFEQSQGTVVPDVSDADSRLDLTIPDASKITWIGDGPGIEFISPESTVRSLSPATEVIKALKATNQFTIEAWVTSATLAEGERSGIVTLSNGKGLKVANVQIAQLGTQVFFRTRTNGSGYHEWPISEGFTDTTSARHIVLTFDSAVKQAYLDGESAAITTRAAGDLSIWDDSGALVLGSNSDDSRSWLGKVYLVAIYNRSLSDSEVLQNFDAGFQPVLGRPGKPRLIH